MSLKDEIEKRIQAEQEKLDVEDQRDKDFHERQSKRFKPLAILLKEVVNSVEKEFLDSEIIEYKAWVSVGIRGDEGFEVRTHWEVEQNFGSHTTHREDGILFYEEPGFRVEETVWLKWDVQENKLTFDTEQELIEYLVKKISKEVASQRHLKEL